MKIGINASFLRKINSGIGQVTANFLTELVKSERHDHEFVVYLEEDAKLDLPVNFQKKVLQSTWYKRDDLIRKFIWEKRLLPKEVKRDGCDVLFSLYQSSTIIEGVKHMMIVHDTAWKIFPEYLGNLRKKIYYGRVDEAIGKADKIITISHNSKKDIAKYFEISEDEIGAMHIDCDPLYKKEVDDSKTTSVLKKYKLDSSKSYIFYVGGFDVRKNVDGLIEAFGKLSEKMSEKDLPNLVITGKFYPHLVPLMTDVPGEIEKVSREVGIPKNKFKMIGFADQKDLPHLYKKAQLFCFPSRYEGFGIMPLEAMNVGCSVVTSNVSSLPEVAPEGSALTVDPENTDEIAEAMKKVLTDEDFRKSLIEKGKKNAQRFSWKKYAREVMAEIVAMKDGQNN